MIEGYEWERVLHVHRTGRGLHETERDAEARREVERDRQERQEQERSDEAMREHIARYEEGKRSR